MSVGLVIVSHSAKIAEGVVDLAGQMAPDVDIRAAGGTEDGSLGTSFDLVAAAITSADSGDGAVILCDLGSAILTAETALDFLDDDARSRVRIVDAPLVEGAVAAAVAAQSGDDLEAVSAAAASADDPDGAAGAEANASSPSDPASPPASAPEPGTVAATVELVNREGLHARPAAEFVKLASTFDASVTINGVDAKSLLRIMSLGLTAGSQVEITARGAQADDALAALTALIESGFGEA